MPVNGNTSHEKGGLNRDAQAKAEPAASSRADVELRAGPFGSALAVCRYAGWPGAALGSEVLKQGFAYSPVGVTERA